LLLPCFTTPEIVAFVNCFTYTYVSFDLSGAEQAYAKAAFNGEELDFPPFIFF